MKKIIILFIFFLFSLSLVSCEIKNEDKDKEKEDKIEEIINKMSVDDKISQTIMIAARYSEDENGKQNNMTVLSAKLNQLIKNHGFNGFILYAQNSVTNIQTFNLINQIQEANKEHLTRMFISVDQEGGRVVRLEEGTQLVGNMALAATNDKSLFKTAGDIIGSELSAFGFNCDFAPVVDINNNPNNPVIGTRSFSDNPDLVALGGLGFIEGLSQNKVIATLKHFPGHGDTETDSHTGLPLINKTYEELKENELKPYLELAKGTSQMIMTAHIQYPKIETNTYKSISTGELINLPATLSKTIITDILRGDYGYQGVVITDAMEMDAIKKNIDRYDAYKLAIEAGVDIVLMPTDLGTNAGIVDTEEYLKTLVDKVNKGIINIDCINEAVRRILKLKAEYGLLDEYSNADYEQRLNKVKEFVGSKEHHDIEKEIALKAITLVKNDNCLPLSQTDATLVITPTAADSLSVEYTKSIFNDSNYNPNIIQANLANSTIEELTAKLSQVKQVILVSQMNNGTYFNSSQLKIYQAILKNCKEMNIKSVVISINLPYDVAALSDARALVLAYSPKAVTQEVNYDVMPIKQYGPNLPAALYLTFTNQEFNGKLPINIYPLDENMQYIKDEPLYPYGYGLK